MGEEDTSRILTEFLRRKTQRCEIVSDNQGPSRIVAALLSQTTDFEQKYRTSLDEMLDQFGDCNRENTAAEQNGANLLSVMNEMFSEGGATWGRVVAMFAFVGGLAARSAIENEDASLYEVEDIELLLTNYINQNLMPWIQEHGGWNGIVQFNSDGGREPVGSPWGGLKKIVCGVAAGAIGAMTIGAFLASKT